MRVRTARTARRRADSLFSRVIRARDRQCYHCGSPRRLECAHIFSRRFAAGRCDEANAIALCHDCHFMFTGNPARFERWVQSWKSEVEYDALRRRVQRVTSVDWATRASELTVRWAELRDAA